jgi:acyl-CoA thioesterase
MIAQRRGRLNAERGGTGMDDVYETAHGRRMIEADAASAALGMRVVRAEPGRAVVRMTVRGEMLNGFAVAHGGLVFALADTALALACNETDAVTLVAGADIAFLSPAREGDELEAVAERRTVEGRSGLYDVRVSAGDGRVVAEVRGRTRTTGMSRP